MNKFCAWTLAAAFTVTGCKIEPHRPAEKNAPEASQSAPVPYPEARTTGIPVRRPADTSEKAREARALCGEVVEGKATLHQIADTTARRKCLEAAIGYNRITGKGVPVRIPAHP